MSARRDFSGNRAIRELLAQMSNAQSRSTSDSARTAWNKAMFMLESHAARIRTEERAMHLAQLKAYYNLEKRDLHVPVVPSKPHAGG